MKKILIVDDDVDIVDLVENRLKKNNYEVTFTNDGDNGYRKAIEQKPDLIIMDVMMPNMHGGEAVKLLKANDITKNIPVLFFTAMNSYLPKGAELDQINVNGQLYPAITKPFEPNKLLAAIKSLLGE
ncbi:MAG: response regulator [Candidatus Omnitrophica bacterium]|nr:response regulator [Candidatus Omnitrophota bacterium]